MQFWRETRMIDPLVFSVSQCAYCPDMILGKCVEEIGDAAVHKPPKRIYKDMGRREEGYWDPKNVGSYEKMPNTTDYPLWNAADFRVTPGGRMPGRAYTAFHFHNFFTRFDQIRVKYETYGHPVAGASAMALGALHSDVELFVQCAMDRRGSAKRLHGGLDALQGDLSLAFQLEAYTKARHEEMQQALVQDEDKYGCNSCATGLASLWPF